GIEELQEPSGSTFLGLPGNGDVPVLGARQAFFEIPRRRGRVRDVSARNYKGTDVEAEQVFGLGPGCRVPVKQGASHAGHDDLVVVQVLPYKGIGEDAVTPDDRCPWPASGILVERLAFFGDQFDDLVQAMLRAVLLDVRQMLRKTLV